ncbi:TetR/AcrR family transcriptional regulator [Specibacter cremeus]|uniref:TetR/AcrR family transcriptional regulator n=1 Tax=Specibacter cremeus TaxID=1629051 RepID=UPI000F7B31A4|nr:TetR/AcrR family transcriptional regulator [Specibacter cremeus]
MARPSAVAQRRREILEATCEVVAERGFRDLRIADVAKVAGYSTGTVHYYFDSKEDLLKDAFRFQYDQSLGRRDGHFEEDDDPVARLRKLADGYLPISAAAVRSWRVWLEFWVSAVGDRSLGEVNEVYYGDWRQTVIETTKAGIDLGLIAVGDPVAFADAFVGMLDGLAIQVLIGSKHMTVERMQATCNAFIDSVAIR